MQPGVLVSQVLASQYYGGLLENLILMELCKQASWAQQEVDIYHFRDNRQHEVDIVLEDSSGGITGIEIKASASVKGQDFKALGKLAEFAGSKLKQGVLFYTGKDILPFRLGDRTFYALPVSLFVS